MTSKQRAYLRSMASQIDTIFQIGKGGLSEAFYKQVDEALTTRELIKVRVLLETTPISPKDAAAELAAHTGAEVIGVVGGVIILYRYSQEKHDKEKQKEKVKEVFGDTEIIKYPRLHTDTDTNTSNSHISRFLSVATHIPTIHRDIKAIIP